MHSAIRSCGLLLWLLVLGGGSACSADPAAQESIDSIAFVDVQALTMTSEEPLLHQTVIVRGDRIAKIGPADEVLLPPGAVRIEGAGRTLMPGLAEMHGHIPPPDAPGEWVEDVLFLYLSKGVTTVRGMLGAPGQLELRDRIASGEILGPTLYLAGPSFSGRSVQSAEQAVERVRRQHREGWDLLKIHPGLTRPQYDAIARTARELGMRFAGHVPSDVGLRHALEMGQETIDHLDGYIEHLAGASGPVSESALVEVARQSREAGAWVVPTMALWETILGAPELHSLMAYPELRYMPADQVARWEESFRRRQRSPQYDRQSVAAIVSNRKRLLKVLHREGVRILLGTDAPQQFSVPGFSIHREIPHMTEAGMTPFDVLLSGTRNVGDYFQNEDRFGTIEAGRRADLILLEGNPLEDLALLDRISGVMVRGHWLSGSRIQQRLERISR